MKDSHENGHSDVGPKIVAFGNCLLDISVEIPDDSILREFELNKDDQGEISGEKLKKITNLAIKRYGSPQYNPGGSALNSIKILSKLGETNTLFCGAIGNDDNGRTLSGLYHDLLGLNTRLQTLEDFATGTCICLVDGPHRSLYANIGAALHYRKDLLINLQFPPRSTDSIVFYIEGYFVPAKIDVCRYIFEAFCQDTSNTLVTNLNARYILDTFGEDMKFLVEKSALVFGNRKEFKKLAEIYGFDDIDRVANYLVKVSPTRKVLVITNGENPVELFSGSRVSFEKTEYKVPKVPKNSIMDTTGAGDGFVAGFLFSYVRKKGLADCVAYGNEVSGKVITTIGCNLPV